MNPEGDRIGYAAWAAGLIGLGAEEDADGDGNLNFVEYALGSRADGADPRPFVRAETEWVEGVAFVRLSFDRRIGADDVVVTPQWSDALGNWVNATVFCDRVEVIAGADGISRESHRCRVPAAQQGKEVFPFEADFNPGDGALTCFAPMSETGWPSCRGM